MQSALFILKCLSEGKNEEYLIQRFDNDEQLVRIWMNLLTELIEAEYEKTEQFTLIGQGEVP